MGDRSDDQQRVAAVRAARLPATSSALDALQRRALVMRRVRTALTVLIPAEMFLYVPPPGVPSPLHPLGASLGLVAFMVLITAASAAVHRSATDVTMLQRWAWGELAADNVLCLAVLYLFAFDQFSSIWTVLVIVALEGAFRGGLRGAMLSWAATGTLYAGVQVMAAMRYPDTAPLDVGSILFRALVTGAVAAVAGQLASQLEQAVDRHRASESALAAQYADLQLIGRVSRAIAAGPEARHEVCLAVAELSGASVVMLYEPHGNVLRCTAAVGSDLTRMPPFAIDDPTSGTALAFREGVLRLVPRATLPGAFRQARPRDDMDDMVSAAFVPVMTGGEAIGALGLAFDHFMPELPARVLAALEVLAEEAAVAITRADLTAHLADQARRDPLTGLVNRRGMEESIETEMRRSRRTRTPMTLLMIDLDGLKAFNDTYGHEAGDRLITAAADAWSARLRPTDVLARYGGDEFVALLPGCDEQLATRVAQALIDGLPPGGACSIGLAEWNRAEDLDGLLKRADAALYAGKRTGGSRVVRALPAPVEPVVSGPPTAAPPLPAPQIPAPRVVPIRGERAG